MKNFCFTGGNYGKKRQDGKTCLRFKKTERQLHKKRPHMPKMEELLNQISVEITRDRTKELMVSKIDHDCAYGQMKLSTETLCIRRETKPTMCIRNNRRKV